jgi:transposase
MKKHCKPYRPEIRALMVELVKAGCTPRELSRKFQPSAQTIANWVAQADRDAIHPDGLTALRHHLAQLRRENHWLKMERNILSHAAERLARASDSALPETREP